MSSFENISDLGIYNISTSNKNKILKLITDSSFLQESKIVILDNNNDLVKTMTVGDGLEITQDSLELKIIFNGVDFKRYVGKQLTGFCNVFILGDRELKFSLKINKSFL